MQFWSHPITYTRSQQRFFFFYFLSSLFPLLNTVCAFEEILDIYNVDIWSSQYIFQIILAEADKVEQFSANENNYRYSSSGLFLLGNHVFDLEFFPLDTECMLSTSCYSSTLPSITHVNWLTPSTDSLNSIGSGRSSWFSIIWIWNYQFSIIPSSEKEVALVCWEGFGLKQKSPLLSRIVLIMACGLIWFYDCMMGGLVFDLIGKGQGR